MARWILMVADFSLLRPSSDMATSVTGAYAIATYRVTSLRMLQERLPVTVDISACLFDVHTRLGLAVGLLYRFSRCLWT